ncbi:MAG TPA: KamA family radical SAM protein [Planctomycetota bacterium]|nr:KamA family radical SAM protein [Planctomycetota bacterium]
MTSGASASASPSAPPVADPGDWRWQHGHAARSLEDVERLFPGRFELAALDRRGIEAAIALYGMRATPYYLGLAARASEQDPIWALAVPSPRELRRTPEERDDPIGDELPRTRPLPALTRRYRDRVLLYPTPVCSVHCRHCFRKRLVGNPDYAVTDGELDAALAWIAGEPELREVILTGGDPLTLSDGRLLALLRRLDALPQLRSLRIHTRMPVVNPFRITEALAALLGTLSKPLFVVAHFNHAREVTPEAAAAAARLRRQGLEVLNQSVLLAGINDEPAAHRALLWALLDARVRPYALHHADLVPGTAHLRTSVARGTELMRALRGSVPGHLLPQYLLDVPGGHGKVPLDGGWATRTPDGRLLLAAPDGSRVEYPGEAR